MKSTKLSYSLLAASAILCGGCAKDWLDAKPNKSLVVPTAIADYQALLDNTSSVMNINQPSLTLTSDGDFYVADTRYNRLSQPERSAYIWAPTTDDFYGGFPCADWQNAYARVLNANVVLDGIRSIKIDPASRLAYNNVKGSALFYRSFDFYNLSQEFCKPYSGTTAAADLGLPLRISSDINLTVKRSTLQQTYDQIISDLLSAAPMLPVRPLYPTRPSKPAVFALLSRVYLSQGNYDRALLYADSCLQLQSALMDFGQLNPSDAHPIPLFNTEVIFSSTLTTYLSFLSSRLIVDSALYQSYVPGDLRATIFFGPKAGGYFFKGSYDGDTPFFGGLATDEIYLDRAECYARAGNVSAAMNDLNTLLRARWLAGSYTNRTAASPEVALSLILAERRKELCFRNLRWTDLRRLNTDPRFATTITRIVNRQTYSLLPNSTRYVLPLDVIEIQLGGLQQNPR